MKKETADKFSALETMVGHTPLMEIALRYRGEERKVFAKVEYYNYTGSIKDRVALHILRKAYQDGTLREGDMVVEATSGNTGIAFAAVSALLGNPVTIFMPDWMSQERVNLIRSYGAAIRLVSQEEGGFLGCIALAERMGEEESVFLPHQFSNQENVEAHALTTGSEILDQMAQLGKKPAGVVAGVGTGGTLMGIRKALRRPWPDCKVFPLDPENSSPLTTGGKAGGCHRIAGIGDEFIPDILHLKEVDDVILVDDGDAINMARKLAAVLGLGVGISSGANFLGALKAQDLLGSREAPVVTVFADDNKKYLSTDLMTEQPEKPDHLTGEIELLGFRSCR